MDRIGDKIMIRFISLSFAFALSVLILLSPQTLDLKSETPDYFLLTVFIVGITIGFLHGTGFDSKKKITGIVFGPVTAWPITMGGTLYFLSQLGFI